MPQTISLVPTSVDLKLYCGDRAAILVNATDGTNPIDLSAGTLLAQIKTNRADTSPKATFTTTINPDGSALLSLTGADTAALAAGGDFRGFWDVQFTPTGGEPVTIVQGQVTASLDVSR